jgi:hypothetical protein
MPDRFATAVCVNPAARRQCRTFFAKCGSPLFLLVLEGWCVCWSCASIKTTVISSAYKLAALPGYISNHVQGSETRFSENIGAYSGASLCRSGRLGLTKGRSLSDQPNDGRGRAETKQAWSYRSDSGLGRPVQKPVNDLWIQTETNRASPPYGCAISGQIPARLRGNSGF